MSKMIRKHLISLTKEDNPEYFAILDGHNSLMAEWNRIGKELQGLKQPKIFLWGHKKKLRKIASEVTQLQTQFLAWNKQAYEMITHPKIVLAEGADSQLSFLHYTSLLMDLRNRVGSDMVMIVDNFQRVAGVHSNQLNFLIAVTSFALTFLGLVAALITIWK